jgi:hypothetical protein
LARNVVQGEAPARPVHPVVMVDVANLVRDPFVAQTPAVPLVGLVVKGVLVVSLARLAVREVVALGRIRRVAMTDNIVAVVGSRVAPIHAVHTVKARHAVGMEAAVQQGMGVVLEEDAVLPARHVVLRVVVHSAAAQYVATMRGIAVGQVRHVAGIHVVRIVQSAVLEEAAVPPVSHAAQEVVVAMANRVVRIRAVLLALVQFVVKEEVVVLRVRLVLWWTVSNFAKNHVVQTQSAAAPDVAT